MRKYLRVILAVGIGWIFLVGIALLLIGPRIPINRTEASISTIAQMCNQLEEEGIKFKGTGNQEVYHTLINTPPTNKYEYYPVSTEADALVDAWGNNLRFYRNEENSIVAWSAGPDGLFDESRASDDILSHK